MRLSHESSAGNTQTVASTVEIADTLVRKATGLMGKKSVPDDYALVFQFDRAKPRTIHMLGVRTPIDVLWVVENEVMACQTLQPWTGLNRARADMVIELQAGKASEIAVGDHVYLNEE